MSTMLKDAGKAKRAYVLYLSMFVYNLERYKFRSKSNPTTLYRNARIQKTMQNHANKQQRKSKSTHCVKYITNNNNQQTNKQTNCDEK
ncbi:unnamed protein product [Ceratitis capitata]|uniref:(Mediterranean fruit fly) hypothetical protein n=1 Tax=Ceratitis capitata TaxID=7213 RepID=A0A811V0R0_CERCA|nr:unnamed protein product [Ceratitis capitata]